MKIRKKKKKKKTRKKEEAPDMMWLQYWLLIEVTIQ
jgi:hypothetical protein